MVLSSSYTFRYSVHRVQHAEAAAVPADYHLTHSIACGQSKTTTATTSTMTRGERGKNYILVRVAMYFIYSTGIGLDQIRNRNV